MSLLTTITATGEEQASYSAESVATVVDGVVTAVAAGTATITVTATNGTDDTGDDKTATCTITVFNPDQEAADAVVTLFNALTADQKALVSAEDLAKLTAAEEALAALESQGVENVQGDVKNVKIIENGQIYILRGDKTYTVIGQEVHNIGTDRDVEARQRKNAES